MVKARLVRFENEAERRNRPRHPVDIEARVRELGTEGSEARILNISDTGFMAECESAFEVGARIWLLMPGRDRAAAEVRWAEGNRLGAEFAEMVDSTTMAG